MNAEQREVAAAEAHERAAIEHHRAAGECRMRAARLRWKREARALSRIMNGSPAQEG
jgi:hypothetical protein